VLRDVAKNLLKSWGYTVYKTQYLPFGCDYKEDIARLSPNLNIETVFDVGANVGQSALQYRKKFLMLKYILLNLLLKLLKNCDLLQIKTLIFFVIN
jgi:hypothetical protein